MMPSERVMQDRRLLWQLKSNNAHYSKSALNCPGLKVVQQQPQEAKNASRVLELQGGIDLLK